jgi:hypothetical protein
MFPFFSESLLGSNRKSLPEWSTTSTWIHLKTLDYDGAVPSSQNGTHELLPCGLKWRRLVKLFKKATSRFYWFDFTVRGQRYRGSTRETKALMAMKVASMKLAHALEHGDLFPAKPIVLAEFSQRFHSWLDEARLEEKTRKYYGNGGRLLQVTPIFGMRLTDITTEDAEKLKFAGSAGNTNCALRTLRRMLHKAEEWKLIARAPKIKLMKEHGRDLRLDEDAEEKLVQASLRCKWRARTRELFCDIIALMRDTEPQSADTNRSLVFFVVNASVL